MTLSISNSQSFPTEKLPTMYDLPSDNPEEPGLPDEFHDLQPELLRQTCRPPNYPSAEIFIASDLNLYYDVNHFNWYKRPDWFLVLGASRLYQGNELRLSYVMWQEKVSPLVVVELLSDGTEEEDLGLKEELAHKPPTKWRVYERILQIPYYLVFSRYTNQLRVFRLIGNRYREQSLTESKFGIPELELSIGLWSGVYQGCQRIWLRWYNAQGDLILYAEEEKVLALGQVEQERLAKEIALQKAERLAAQLRAMGINPENL
ncbi:hypothetical protein BCD67_23530 [Oscillatoriales cyanobacterium USR001]|nr:hypothetical protein BCD67_23530 [Oscillatoriales cyanobacterium USR001]